MLLLLAGCTPDAGAAQKSGDGELRHDLAPLTERFPQLGEPESAEWVSGTLGDAPGPSLYWIDAVVVLSPEDYAALADGYELEETTEPDAEVGLPDGPLLRSDQLDAAYSLEEFQSEVFLDDASRSLVLITIFE